jgi:hypothetical protein
LRSLYPPIQSPAPTPSAGFQKRLTLDRCRVLGFVDTPCPPGAAPAWALACGARQSGSPQVAAARSLPSARCSICRNALGAESGPLANVPQVRPRCPGGLVHRLRHARPADSAGDRTSPKTQPKDKRDSYIGVGRGTSSRPDADMQRCAGPIPRFGDQARLHRLRHAHSGFQLATETYPNQAAVARPGLPYSARRVARVQVRVPGARAADDPLPPGHRSHAGARRGLGTNGNGAW